MVLVSLDKNFLLLVYAFHNNALNFANFHNAGKENLLDVSKANTSYLILSNTVCKTYAWSRPP